MKKISQLVVLLCAVAPIAAFSVTPDAPASTNSAAKAPSLDALFGDSIVAKGKGVEVKRNALDSAVIKAKNMYVARQIPAPSDLEAQALKNLVMQQLILGQATDADRTKGKSNFENRLAKVKADSGMSDADFDKRINMQLFGGETREQWNKEFIDQATIPVVLERELKVNVTDADVKAFYDSPTNAAAFEEPEKVRVSHILLMTKDPQNQDLADDKKAAKHKQMEDLLKRARAGEDFAKLADQYSEDPGVKENHGEYTFSQKDPFVPEFKTAAFGLSTNGQVSEIITSQFGYHILKLSEKIPAKKVDFEKVKDGIKDHLVQLAMQKQLPDYTKKLIKDANIEILDEKLKNIDLAIEAPKDDGSAPTPPPSK